MKLGKVVVKVGGKVMVVKVLRKAAGRRKSNTARQRDSEAARQPRLRPAGKAV